MTKAQEVLKNYWGYNEFRSLQEDIINSVLAGNDTLGLLPTGGGKSICFQVPALILEGVCIVVTPLIALMKDQIEILLSKGINAMAIYSGMSKAEIDTTLDNCRFGNVKFLYLSPERLKTEIVIERVKRMKVCLLVVDEAHCISQWGYDFRPAYLEIGQFRSLLQNLPILALTATATTNVAADIQEKLNFKKSNLYSKSFERPNLIYYSIEEENKLERLVQIFNKISGTGIVYVRNRKRTKDVAEFLSKRKISAQFYHGGLEQQERDKKQHNWKTNVTRVIVCTNAFGMGIDKPDVRVVVHLDLPDSIEAYFQEAGRGGRDGKTAHAIILFDKGDKILAKENWILSYPTVDKIQIIYQGIANYLQLAIGSGLEAIFDFDIDTFSSQYKLQPILVFSCLQVLEREGYLVFNKEKLLPTRLKILVNNMEYYNFEIKYPKYEELLKTILRSYGDAFEKYVKINEYDIARKVKRNVDVVISDLNTLSKLKIIEYLPQSKSTQLIFLLPRVDSKMLTFANNSYKWRMEQSEQRLNALINYTYNRTVCRSVQLLQYFAEKADNCGFCDVCIEMKKHELTTSEFEKIKSEIISYLEIEPHSIDFLKQHIVGVNQNKLTHSIQLLLDSEIIAYNNDMKLYQIA